jgi:hypothetical protein
MLAGADAVKLAGEKYLPRLDSQSDEEEEFRNRLSSGPELATLLASGK